MTKQPHFKCTQISLHVDEALRRRLESAAKAAVRTLSGEITYRLQRSLDESETVTAA